MRLAVGLLCSAGLACSTDVSGLLATGACDPNGLCLTGFVCDALTNQCVPVVNAMSSGGTGGDGGSANDDQAPSSNDDATLDDTGNEPSLAGASAGAMGDAIEVGDPAGSADAGRDFQSEGSKPNLP